MVEYVPNVQDLELRDLAFIGPAFLALDNKELGRNKDVSKNRLKKSDG